MKIGDGGLMTTIQDLGRFGYQHVGVTPSGALDQVAHRMANQLVGNPDDAATIEVTLRGPAIEFTDDALVALCGADLSPTIADASIPTRRAIAVRAGAVLRFGRAASGVRCYVATAGGVDTPLVMGSRSTYVRAGFGGHEGRALRAGDELETGPISPSASTVLRRALALDDQSAFALTERAAPDDLAEDRSGPVRYVRGPHFEMLPAIGRDAFTTADFEVSPRSDRMGYRLKGPHLDLANDGDLLSTGVAWGTVQLPPSGEPIVLMADRQTTGGYPMIATVITADLPRLAQLKPGDMIRFTEVSVGEAQQILNRQEGQIDKMKKELDARASHRPQL
ncbi:MAG: biotin-dependent carboxyltransferase family protein [Actinomycetota bacterium]|nr:biotin-dependent carboxyltransferase family protein [Actinomycetota bacterium]